MAADAPVLLRPVRVHRNWAALAAVLAIATFFGPLDRLGEERSIAAHVLQHLLLISAVPAALAAGLRPALAPRQMTPAQAAALLSAALVVIWVVHVPPVMDATVREPLLNDVSHLAVLGAGMALVWPLAGPGPLRGMPALAYLGVAELAVGALGLLLTWYPEPLYAAYAGATPPLGMDPATDQAIAGALLLVIEEPFLAIEVAVLFIALLNDDQGDDEP